MRVAIVGAGTTGLFMAVALARRGHIVELVERDTGPVGSAWPRRGVMQFEHPHAFRKQACDALLARLPDVFDSLLAAGAEIATIPELPGVMLSMRCRRSTFERVLRESAQRQPGVRFRTGHADAIASERNKACGVTVDGHHVAADLVIDASGRAGRLTRELRASAEGGDCGFAYVSRQYQLIPGADPGPVNAPIGMVAVYDRYLAIVFTHELGTFSTLILRTVADDQLADLRNQNAFDAATQAIPALAAWTHPSRSLPLSPVLPGGGLYNSYQGQLDSTGSIPLHGLICLGDTVCTTNPVAGRGVATGFMQAQRLLALLEEHGSDFTGCARTFDTWCAETIKPWFDDHVDWDAQRLRRWSGHDVDLSVALPSDLICAAAEVLPELMRVVGPYQAMMSPPSSLEAVEPVARKLYLSGWRPTPPAGPSHDELIHVIEMACQKGIP